jgi:hypothetical protein
MAPSLGENRGLSAARNARLLRPGGRFTFNFLELFQPEPGGTVRECAQRLLVAVFGDPDLRFDKDAGSCYTRTPDALANLTLVTVRGRRVDVAISRQ